MQEDHEVKISNLMDNLLARLDFDIKNQPPEHIPAITSAITILYQLKNGQLKNDERHMMEINIMKNVNNQIKGFGKGGQDGGNRKI